MTGKLDQHGQPGGGLHLKARTERSCAEMIGLCKGVIADGRVCQDEARFMLKWFMANPEAANCWPGGQLAARLAEIWKDNVVTDEELADLKETIIELTGLIGPAAAELPHNTATRLPFDNPEPKVVFAGQSFCFTGKTVAAPRKACEEMTRELGGEIKKEPVTTLDYLVVGFLGSRDWKQSSHGTKIMKAMEYRDKGHPIKIISEDCWLKGMA